MFFYLAILTLFFVFLEISFFIQCNQAYLSDFSFVAGKIHIPYAILPGILHFTFAQLLLHAAFCGLIWLLAALAANTLRVAEEQRLRFAVGVWLVGVLTILTANQYYFPNSKMTELTQMVLINPELTRIVLWLLLSGCAVISVLALISMLSWIPRLRTGRQGAGLIVVVFVSVFLASGAALKSKHEKNIVPITLDKPNIILIGIDSLRPDFIGFFGGKTQTPFFNAFLNKAAIFGKAVTPLARTFPSWTGILTGRYPKEINVRSNLAQQNNLPLKNTLPAILRRHGYQTIFATDETRFSNIDKNFGFDEVLTPPIGLNDFLLGTFNDFPLSNLMVNTRIGQWLFPYSFGNRPVYFTYNPISFLNLLHPAVSKAHRPLFLAVHFCLPHNPYLWGSLRGNDFDPRMRYVESISAVDEQIKQLFMMLQKAHILDNAIVVLLSDHGEALELSGDRVTEQDFFVSERKNKKPPHFYPPSLDDEAVNQSAGHGTDVLGLSQYHTLLAFKAYGLTKQFANKKMMGTVSMLDIKPTILQLLHLPSTEVSGVSLAGSLTTGKNHLKTQRHIFLESDFSPAAIRTVYPDTRKVVLEGIELFEVDPTNARLTVKEKMARMIIHSKQYADIYGDWILALYPQNSRTQMPILVNLKTGYWTNDLGSKFAKKSPAGGMLTALKRFYGNEINSVKK
ncbi:MAG: sulfatase-like hydrolase/transferase [Gammaproteobacteria bacterium]